MRHNIYKLGHTRTVIVLTLVAVLLALIITLAFVYILHQIGIQIYPVVAGLISICAALIIAPLMSWYLVGLILTIHQLEEEMRALATYDALTGLLSRRVFLEQTDYFHNIAIRDGMEYSVIIVDLDNFKKINDQYGHAAGDKTLESFGKAVRNTFRESDLACRFGGDEFVFFLPNTSSKQAWNFSERLQAVIREAIEHDDLLIHYTASMGLVTFPEVIATNIEEVIRAADKALYRAKTKGGNHTQVFNANWDR